MSIKNFSRSSYKYENFSWFIYSNNITNVAIDSMNRFVFLLSM